MAVIKKIYRYAQLHFLRNPLYFFVYSCSYLMSSYIPRIRFIDSGDVATEVAKGKSLIRLGDGEIYLLNHGDIHFEQSSPGLRELMMSLIKEYKEDSPYVLCLNKAPLVMTNQELKKVKLLSCWLPSKVYFNLYFNREANYGDASMFYFKETIPKYFESYFKTKKIVIVTNEKQCELLRNNKTIPFASDFITTPESNAFAQYKEIKAEILSFVEKVGQKDALVLVAFGPASKAMVFELAKAGIQAVDIGHGISAAYTDKDHSLSENIRVLQ